MTTVYGASDDLIEVEGDITEEFNHYDEDAAVLAFSDGTVLRVRYADEGDGIWRITPEAKGELFDRIDQCTGDGFGDAYSDHAYLDAGVTWVVYGTDMAVKR